MINIMKCKGEFEGGQLVLTYGVNNAIAEDLKFSKFVLDSLQRHLAGDWGDMEGVDKEENNFSVDKHLRLFSSYRFDSGKIWIITEADRSATTVLFPDEY